MNISNLIHKLENAGQKFIKLAEKEKKKAEEAEYLHSIGHHVRSVSREGFFRERSLLIEELLENVKSFTHETPQIEKEEMIFLARQLITEASFPWIRRKVLYKEFYDEIQNDPDFEPYAKDLLLKQEAIKNSSIKYLNLWDELEYELGSALSKKASFASREKYYPIIKDVIINKGCLKDFFMDDWTQKTDLICFRLYELGLG